MSVNRIENDKMFYDVLKEIINNSKILESNQYIQHGNTSTLLHSIAVAYYSHRFAMLFNLPVDETKLIRGALLHDYYLYDWHKKDHKHHLHGIRHPYIALQNATRDLDICDIEKDIIQRHMFPLTMVPPRYMESVIVCIVDKICSIYETFYFDAYFKLYGYSFEKVVLC